MFKLLLRANYIYPDHELEFKKYKLAICGININKLK
jgi:hypothetical protein